MLLRIQTLTALNLYIALDFREILFFSVSDPTNVTGAFLNLYRVLSSAIPCLNLDTKYIKNLVRVLSLTRVIGELASWPARVRFIFLVHIFDPFGQGTPPVWASNGY